MNHPHQSYTIYLLQISLLYSTFQGSVEKGNNVESKKGMEREESVDETQHSGLPTTSTPKKHGVGPASHQNVQISPVKSVISQQTQASQEEFDVDSYLNFLHGDKSPECSQRSAGHSWQDEYTKCDICQTCCRIASHLRRSKECLMQLKSKPEFKFKGSDQDEVFIVKIALIIGECPSSCCLTGRHSDIPQDCVEWWKSEGWERMGWRGDREKADESIIKEKIRNFVRYERRKNNQQGQTEAGTQVSQSTSDIVSSKVNETGWKCSSCGHDGDLIQHLYASYQCLDAYAENHLTKEEVEPRKSIFQLAIVLNMCARADCGQKKDFTYLAAHLNNSEDCLQFYQREGVDLALPSWNSEAGGRMISKKISQMRRIINDRKRKEERNGCVFYREELAHVLNHICCKCGAMGPVAGEEDFVMRGGWTDCNDDPSWFCSKCFEDDPSWTGFREKLTSDIERLKGPRHSQHCDLKIVESQTLQRLTLAPTCLTDNNVDITQLSPTLSTLVLVPNHPSAIRAIKNWCDETVEEKSELNRCTDEILKRPIVTNLEQTLSCLYRSLLADMRSKMKDISIALSKGARGEVVSLNPNVTNARKRSPNLEMTMEGALRSLCNWSPPHDKQRSLESEARSHINGRVKIHIRGTILDDLEDEDLKRILLLGYKSFEDEKVNSFEEIEGVQGLETFIINMTPVVLKYIHAKVKLFIKHIIAPNYSNHDLRLEIDDKRLKVQIHGYVYARQFNNVNKMVAENQQLKWIPEVSDRVATEEEILPTATLNWQDLCKVYKIDKLRAKDIAEVANSCQIGNIAFPLSLLNLWTPSGWNPSEKEKVLRNRVEVLSDETSNDEDVKEAIIDITVKIQEEGLFEELVTEDIDRDILQGLKLRLIDICPDEPPHSVNALMWYHTLLLRTGGSNQWTLRRHCGQSCVIPYHPLLLEALRANVEVRIAMEPEHIEAKPICDEASAHEGIMAGFAWKEISILKFLDGISRNKHEEPVSQAIVTVITSPGEEFDFKDSNEKDEECDEIFINSKNESYIITNGDLRKLYAKRPEAMKEMTFAEFVISYYKKQKHQQATIDPQSGIGDESNEQIVGGSLRAPSAMKLSNNIIMKRRAKKSKPVPLLLQSNTLDDYGEHILFQPWRTLEEIGQGVTVEDKERQQQNRLALFPLSHFPRSEQD